MNHPRNIYISLDLILKNLWFMSVVNSRGPKRDFKVLHLPLFCQRIALDGKFLLAVYYKGTIWKYLKLYSLHVRNDSVFARENDVRDNQMFPNWLLCNTFLKKISQSLFEDNIKILPNKEILEIGLKLSGKSE